MPAAVLVVGEFRALWSAELLSVMGDQLARVALAVLVYDRTGAGAAAAAVYALTFLPALLGGVLLGWTADRFRRRTVMILCDTVRAAGVAAMAIPAVPLPLVSALLVSVVVVGAPHSAAQGALMPEILAGDAYDHGLAVRQITTQSGQLAGFAVGGVVVAALGSEPALLVDAASFLAAAVIVRVGLADRPPPSRAAGPPARTRICADVIGGLAAIARDPRRRVLVGLAWTVGWFVVPEGLAAPYAAELHEGSAAVGLLMAADPLGSALGAWLFVRFVPSATRERLVGALAVAAGLPLVAVVAMPGLLPTLLLWGISGMCSTAYLLQTQTAFVRATPDAGRGGALGVAASGIVASQGVAILIAGVIADAAGPAHAVALCGAIGSLLALLGAVAWRAVG